MLLLEAALFAAETLELVYQRPAPNSYTGVPVYHLYVWPRLDPPGRRFMPVAGNYIAYSAGYCVLTRRPSGACLTVRISNMAAPPDWSG